MPAATRHLLDDLGFPYTSPNTFHLMPRSMARDYVTLIEREVDGVTEWSEPSVTRQRITARPHTADRAESEANALEE